MAEIPAEWAEVRAFFEKSRFLMEARYGDFVLDDADAPGADANDPRAGLVVSLTFDELVESGALEAPARRAWRRTKASLRARAADLESLAVATDRIEAHLVTAPTRDGTAREVLAIGAESGGQGTALLGLLVARARAEGGSLRIPTIAEDETSFATLAQLGFRRERETIGYVAAPR